MRKDLLVIPQSPPPPTRSKRAILLAVLAGLVIGGGGVGLAWALSGTSDPTGTDADARAVCGILARTPDPVNFDQFGLPDQERWAAAADLSAAIAAANPRYQPLADALKDANTAVQQLNLPRVRTAAGTARQVCARL